MKHEEIMKALEEERNELREKFEAISSEIKALESERLELRERFARVSSAVESLSGHNGNEGDEALTRKSRPARSNLSMKIRTAMSLAPEGLTARQIADRVGGEYSHVYQQLVRAKEMLIKETKPGTSSPVYRLPDDQTLDGDNHANASDNGAQ